MTARILECQHILPGTDCTLLFIGSESDVIRAATDHAQAVHGVSLSGEALDSVRDQLELLIVPGSDRTDLSGANFEQVGNLITIVDAGYVLTRFDSRPSPAFDESADVVTVDCRCRDGVGSCNTVVDESLVRCTGDCVRCAAVVTIPPGPAPPLKVLAPPAF